jgi:hypothetical protein
MILRVVLGEQKTKVRPSANGRPNMQSLVLGRAGHRAYGPGHRAESVRGRRSGTARFPGGRMERRPRSSRPASVVVTINQPQVEHRVRIKDFDNWLDSTAKSPAEMSLKSR